MGKMSKSKKHYTEEFKLTVLKDKYANNLSIYSAAKKYGKSLGDGAQMIR